MKKPANISASVKSRLLNIAKMDNRPYNEVLQYFAIERFLYRLYISPHANKFILKGALILQFWGGNIIRSTKDIDFLGQTENSLTNLKEIFEDCFTVDVPEDGIRYSLDSLEMEEITVNAEYKGIRAHFLAFIEKTRISLQVDVGFGDMVIPGAQMQEYPTLLDFEPPRLLTYTPESTIAEKFQAIVVLDMANSRMKDFYDIWLLSQNMDFEGPLLKKAIKATFEKRGTPFFNKPPIGLTEKSYDNPTKNTQWKAFFKRSGIKWDPPSLKTVIMTLEALLMPPMKALYNETDFNKIWRAGRNWE